MKTLKIKETGILMEEGSTETATTKDLIKLVCKFPPANGFDYNEMKRRSRIEIELTKSNGSLKLDDDVAHDLAELTEAVRWNFRHPDLIEFMEDIKKLKQDGANN